MKKIILWIIVILVILTTIFIIGNDYEMVEKKVTIPTNSGQLSTVMTFPKNKKAKGVIVFVHGDGAQLATQNGGYLPLMERFAKQGYVSVSWDKLGVGNSTGNWLDQSMSDRANEVSEVIEWLKEEHSDITNSIGLWGASQAGWVIPKVMNEPKNKIKFALLAAPAINWIRQGEYNTVWQAKDAHQSAQKASMAFLKDVELIKTFDTTKQYQKYGGTDIVSEDRYQFIKRNMNEDSTNEIKAIKQPIALILAEKDKNVDSTETRKIYEKEIQSHLLTVEMIKNVNHQMINPLIANSDMLINITGLMLPKYLLIDKAYLDFCEDYVSKQ